MTDENSEAQEKKEHFARIFSLAASTYGKGDIDFFQYLINIVTIVLEGIYILINNYT